MKKKNRSFNNIPIRFTGTYLLLLLTVIGFSLAIVKTPVGKIESDVLNGNRVTLRQKSGLVDEKLCNIQKIACQIGNNPFINHLESPTGNGSFFLDLNKSKSELFDYRYKLDDDFVHDYFVYYATRNYIVTPDTCYSSDLFHSSIVKPLKQGGNTDSFFRMISRRHKDVDYESVSLRYQSEAANCICYIMPIVSMEKPEEIENLCMLIPNSYFDRIFSKDGFSSAGYLQIFSPSGKPLFQINYGGSKAVSPALNPAAFGKDSVQNKKIGGEDMTVVCSVSPKSQWKYIWVQPQSVAMNDLYTIRRSISLLFIAALIIGVAIALSFAYFNSKPILHIGEELRQTNATPNRKCDTFQGISESLDTLISDKIRFEKKLSLQKPLLRNTIAGQLLNGCCENLDTVLTNLDYLGISPDTHSFLVCSVNFSDAQTSDGGALPESMKEISLARTCFKELACQALLKQVLYHENDLDSLALIASFPEPDKMEQFPEMLDGISQKLLQQCGVMILIGISAPCGSLAELAGAYQESQEALNFTQYDRRIIKYAYIPVRSFDYYYPLEFEQRLINTICLGKVNSLNDILNTILVENFSKRKLANYSLKQLYSDLLSTCFRLTHKIPVSAELNSSLKKVPEHQLVKQSDFAAIFSVLRQICSTVSFQKSDRNKRFIQKILDYVNNSYSNPDLSLSNVAEKFNISPGYLSTFFKKQTGKNFTDHVETVRISAACKLLENSDLTIGEICLKVGYSNVKSFRRAFKRIKGVSPKIIRQELLSPDT